MAYFSNEYLLFAAVFPTNGFQIADHPTLSHKTSRHASIIYILDTLGMPLLKPFSFAEFLQFTSFVAWSNVANLCQAVISAVSLTSRYCAILLIRAIRRTSNHFLVREQKQIRNPQCSRNHQTCPFRIHQ